jgi:hypothetical protein
MLPPLVRETTAGLTVAGMWAASFITVHSYEFLQVRKDALWTG